MVRESSDTTPALVWGNVLHEVMQRSLRDGSWAQTDIDARIDDIIHTRLGDLIQLGVGVDGAKREVKIRAKGLRTFADRYIASTPKVLHPHLTSFLQAAYGSYRQTLCSQVPVLAGKTNPCLLFQSYSTSRKTSGHRITD
jgi:hypothetical protein